MRHRESPFNRANEDAGSGDAGIVIDNPVEVQSVDQLSSRPPVNIVVSNAAHNSRPDAITVMHKVAAKVIVPDLQPQPAPKRLVGAKLR